MNEKNQKQELFFMGIILSLVVGVPLTIFSIYYFSDNVTTLVTAVIIAILITTLLSGIFILFRDRIMTNIFGKSVSNLTSISEELMNAGESYSKGEIEKGHKFTKSAIKSTAAFIGWIQVRKWMIAASVGLLVAFAGLIGSSLLHQQNKIILQQNEYFRTQIAQQQNQIESQEKLNNQNTRSKVIEQIYGSEYIDNPRVKAEAVKALVQVERTMMSYAKNSLATDYINLHEANLSLAWLENSDLMKVSFRESNLNRANLSATTIDTCSFRYSLLNKAMFLTAKINHTQFALAELDSASFNNAKLDNVFYATCSMRGATFNGAEFINTSFYRCDLRNSSFDYVESWDSLKIENCNLFGIKTSSEMLEWLKKEEFENFFDENSDNGFKEHRKEMLDMEEGI